MLALLAVVGFAADPAVALSDAPAGSITAQAAGGPARLLPARPTLPAGELLTVLPGTTVRSANGAVSLTCRADPSAGSPVPVPVLETAYTLEAAPDADLALTLDRGRIDLTNTKPDGSSTVHVKLHQFAWTIILDRPASRVAVELAGRRSAGTRFVPDAKPAEPVLSAVLVALAGTATVSDGRTTVVLAAPPGPALLNWTSTRGADPKPARLDRLPPWANPAADTTDGRMMRAAVEKFRTLRAANADTAADVLLASKVPAEWRVGLAAAAASDDLLRLATVMTGAADPAVWDAGVAVLRHWLGRGPGQDARLYRFLTETRQYDPAAAATVIDLLAGFTPAELARPETYDVLVEYLQHDKPGVRNLAHWHLTRLVPAGKSIAFKPNAGKGELEPAYKEWRKLIPAGTVPAGTRAKEAAGRS